MSRAAVLPVLVVALLYGVVGPSVALAAVLVVLALGSMLVRVRVPLGGVAQIVVAVLVMALGGTLLATFLPRGPLAQAELPTAWAVLAGSLLLVATGRLYVASPIGGEPVGVAIALFALMASGGVDSGRIYPGAVALFMAGAMAARRGASASRAPLGALLSRHAFALGAMLAIGWLVASSLTRWIPDGHAWAMQQLSSVRPPTVGVGDRLWLGSMRGLLDSRQPVVRVRGHAELLRGVTFNRYDSGRWSRTDPRFETLSTPTSLEGADVLELEWLGGEPRHYFVPENTGELALSSGLARKDALGNLDPIEAHPATRLYARPGASGAFATSEPSSADLGVPRRLEAELRAIALTYVGDVATDSEKLAALERGLQRDHPYSLEFERSPYSDPVLEFLSRDGGGHCEYFAASLALLARTLGIPARVVIGYRVVETNPLSGDSIVRESDAHAWVEAWAGAGRTYDPTPAGEAALLPARTTGLPGALLDVLGAAGSRFLSWLDGLSVAEALAAPALLLALGGAVRWWRVRGERRQRSAREGLYAPLPCFPPFTEALASRGLELQPHDTVEALARRVATADVLGEHAPECATVLRRYAALRYGDCGDASDVAARMSALVRVLRTLR